MAASAAHNAHVHSAFHLHQDKPTIFLGLLATDAQTPHAQDQLLVSKLPTSPNFSVKQQNEWLEK